ncbi:hypothetical protein CRENBAI_019196 [Crenichthys baileyi]|uniref:Uncharacterized protein n=1 Tax=Crenichthys baileyi TaxID=28760 RepID=A0AAV9SAJ3_9TELE
MLKDRFCLCQQFQREEDGGRKEEGKGGEGGKESRRGRPIPVNRNMHTAPTALPGYRPCLLQRLNITKGGEGVGMKEGDLGGKKLSTEIEIGKSVQVREGGRGRELRCSSIPQQTAEERCCVCVTALLKRRRRRQRTGHTNTAETRTNNTTNMAQAAKHLRKNKDLEAQLEKEEKEKEEERLRKRSRSRDKKRKVLGPFTGGGQAGVG